ncbi:Rv1678 family membrane protein [Nocardia australiensis]|uniref:Rv1678 family membrane protein n=1 Tax=Nocardia australiensis TaxID=2887191 RepID=UPI001D14CEC0|nr:hypothetical protein [Nocardia australiensis]
MAAFGRRAFDLVTSTAAPPPEVGAAAVSGLRIVAGLLWLYNVVWKQPPDFGRSGNSGLYHFTVLGTEHPVFGPYTWLVNHVVLPNFTAFGWTVLVVETVLAVLLLTGTAVRIAALIGVGQSLAIGLSVAEAPGEWPWSYIMLVGIHLVLLLTASGRYAAVDAVRAAASRPAGGSIAVRLLLGWAVALALVGIIGGTACIVNGDSAARGALVGIAGLEISLGNYNVRGALTLIVVATLMLVGALRRMPALTLAGAAIATAAAISIYLQLTRAEVWLGGTNTSAAVFLCAAVVCAACSNRISHYSPRERRPGQRGEAGT